MKGIITILLTLSLNYLNSQITLSATYAPAWGKTMYLTKLHVNGYKYVETDGNNNLITIYNTDHTVFKTINIPAQTMAIQGIGYVSEHLFDLDDDIEYQITTYQSMPLYNTFKIYDETGTMLFYRDSATLNQTNSIKAYGVYIADPIFFDGTQTRMRLQCNTGYDTYVELYDLPGTLTCFECSGGTVAGLIDNSGGFKNTDNPVFYPNPTDNYIKLRYEIPIGINQAKIVIRDINGKQFEKFDVTASFEYILLDSKYSDGLYYFDLIVDQEIITSEKIIIQQ